MVFSYKYIDKFIPSGTKAVLHNNGHRVPCYIDNNTLRVNHDDKIIEYSGFSKIFVGQPYYQTWPSGLVYAKNAYGNTLLLEVDQCNYVLFENDQVYHFTTEEPIIEFVSTIGNNDVPYCYALTKNYVYELTMFWEFYNISELKRGKVLISTDEYILYDDDIHALKNVPDNAKFHISSTVLVDDGKIIVSTFVPKDIPKYNIILKNPAANLSEDEYIKVIDSNPYALAYIEKQTEDMVLYAMKKNILSFKVAKVQTLDIIKYLFSQIKKCDNVVERLVGFVDPSLDVPEDMWIELIKRVPGVFSSIKIKKTFSMTREAIKGNLHNTYWIDAEYTDDLIDEFPRMLLKMSRKVSKEFGLKHFKEFKEVIRYMDMKDVTDDMFLEYFDNDGPIYEEFKGRLTDPKVIKAAVNSWLRDKRWCHILSVIDEKMIEKDDLDKIKTL